MATLSADVESVHLDRQNSPKITEQADFAKYAEEQPGDTLPFYEVEGKILALWDQLNELKIELSIAENSAPETTGLLSTTSP